MSVQDECECFESSVKNYLKRQKKRLEKKHGSLPSEYNILCQQALSIRSHSTHVLSQLWTKRQSLAHAINAFEIICKECIAISDAKNAAGGASALCSLLQDVLKHIFIQYIHIRDGFVLLTSGECRHNGDATIAKKKGKFRSHLNTPQKRKDGYTLLFSSKCGYSGYGWDEFQNEEVGIRRRLLDTLRRCCIYPRDMNEGEQQKFREGDAASRAREKIWDVLLESGGQLFESAFDTHENEVKELHKKLERIRTKFMSNMEKILPAGGRLVMNTEDKFERLELKNANGIGFAAICIQRQGDAFKGADKSGALPSGAGKDEWLKLMRLPGRLANDVNASRARGPKRNYVDNEKSRSDGSKKKRITIVDSEDGEEDSDESVDEGVNDSINCLKVKVTKAPADDKLSSSSLSNIKEKFGTSVGELQRARDDLLEEEKATANAAYVDEIGELLQSSRQQDITMQVTNETATLKDVIYDEEENSHIFRSICKRTKNQNDDEAWDARESLRSSLMSLGSYYLELNGLLHANPKYSLIKKANSCFKESLKVVKNLESRMEHERENISSSDSDFKFRQRALLLVKGRANTNIGKASFEESEFLTRNGKLCTAEGISKLKTAVKYLDDAEINARMLRARAVSHSSSDQNTDLHKVNASDLECLACRFQGYALLRLAKEGDCIKSAKKSCGIEDDDGDSDGESLADNPLLQGDPDVAAAKLGLILEQYSGACGLVNIVSSLFNTPLRNTDKNSDNSDDKLLILLAEAYDRARKISQVLEMLSLKDDIDHLNIKELVLQNEVTPSHDILSAKDIAMKRLKERKCGENRRLSSMVIDQRNPVLLRNDLFRNGAVMPRNEPSERVVLDNHNILISSGAQPQGMKRNSKKLSDDAFDNFGLHTNAGDDGVGDEESANKVEYRKWGDEIFEELGIPINQYPSCEPKKPLEMLQELGIEE